MGRVVMCIRKSDDEVTLTKGQSKIFEEEIERLKVTFLIFTIKNRMANFDTENTQRNAKAVRHGTTNNAASSTSYR
jgi:hypothetical protein